jgi:hypothetical protein
MIITGILTLLTALGFWYVKQSSHRYLLITGRYTHIGFFSRIRLPMLGSLHQLSGQLLSDELRCVVVGARARVCFILILTRRDNT